MVTAAAAARLVRDYPDDPEMRVSHETIYRSLFVQARGALRKELTRCLRSGPPRRQPHRRTNRGGELRGASQCAPGGGGRPGPFLGTGKAI
jgi:IS30 family transposase